MQPLTQDFVDLRVVRLPQPAPLEVFCRANGFDEALVGGFYQRPELTPLGELRTGGDRIHAIAGIMSGSLAWLFDRFDGSQPFSQLVREAGHAGFTEPDPREDLSGQDVARAPRLTGRVTLHLLSLATGTDQQIAVRLGQTAGGAGTLAWSPDSRWLFVVTAHGRLAAVNAHTLQAEGLGVRLPWLSQIATRPG